jgi:hypothetical protein
VIVPQVVVPGAESVPNAGVGTIFLICPPLDHLLEFSDVGGRCYHHNLAGLESGPRARWARKIIVINLHIGPCAGVYRAKLAMYLSLVCASSLVRYLDLESRVQPDTIRVIRVRLRYDRKSLNYKYVP